MRLIPSSALTKVTLPTWIPVSKVGSFATVAAACQSVLKSLDARFLIAAPLGRAPRGAAFRPGAGAGRQIDFASRTDVGSAGGRRNLHQGAARSPGRAEYGNSHSPAWGAGGTRWRGRVACLGRRNRRVRGTPLRT